MADRAQKIPTAEEWNVIISEIQHVENHAHKLGMHATAQALNKAKNTAGWERADELMRAGH